LLDHLRRSLEDNSGSIEELSPYFLGSIVLSKGVPPETEIVDG
jgi:hypothetical protein